MVKKVKNQKAAGKDPRDSADWELYAGAQMEEMRDMFQAITEQTAEIPRMQKQLARLEDQGEATQERLGRLEIQGEAMQGQIGTMQGQIGTMQGQIGTMQGQIERILTWEDDIKLIPAMFEEIGGIRRDLEVLRAGIEDRNKAERVAFSKLERRVDSLEREIAALRR